MVRYTSTSVFSSNTITNRKTVFQSNVVGVCMTAQRQFMINLVLKDILAITNAYLNYYMIGDMDSLKTVFTTEKFLALTHVLVNMPFLEVTETLIRDVVLKTLASLRGAIFHFDQYENIKEQYENVKEENEILHDRDKLNEYIQQLNSRIQNDQLFTSSFTAPAPQINGTYFIYIKNFGYPENAVFDPILLAKIQNGEIT